MDKTLNSIYMRLDVNMQNLSHNAIAQIIVKILYAKNNSLSAADIKNELKRLNNGMNLNDKEIDCILEELQKTEIKYRDHHYYLSTNKRKNISKAIKESTDRKEIILEKYFNRLNSEKKDVEDWLSDATILFFNAYSDEWISDLKVGTGYISNKEQSIRSMINNSTQANKRLNQEDKKELPTMFFDFISTDDALVNSYLWEYGTAAFASKLIRTMHGVDTMTLETFRNSHCILDTNILLFIVLESRYEKSFHAIEKVFSALNIRASILYITQKEYEHKVFCQKEVTLHNLDRLGYDVTALPNDDFTTLAKKRQCTSREDFERFFKSIEKVPSKIDGSLSINLYDNSSDLNDIILKAENNEELKSLINTKYSSLVGHNKTKNSLQHDVGLLEGVKYLRSNPETKDEKFFILSEELSINLYSKQIGFVHNLPLSLRIDTLINLLAINNGGDTFDASDYVPLFANIIRLGLVPKVDTFRQSELYDLSQMDMRLADLPTETKVRIVKQIHRNMLDGMDESTLLRDMRELVTNGEIQAGQKVDEMQEKLHFAKKELENTQKLALLTEKCLRERLRDEATCEYDKETKRQQKRYWIKFILIVASLMLFVYIMVKLYSESGSYAIISSLATGAVSSYLITYLGNYSKIRDRKVLREASIDSMVDAKYDSEIKNK